MTGLTVNMLLAQAAASVAQSQAQLLLQSVLECNLAWLYAHPEGVISQSNAQKFWEKVFRRARGEPLAYVLGVRGFRSLNLLVGPETLIPRVETETLVEVALELIPKDCAVRVADLGTGSGAIACAIACERPSAAVIGTDISVSALRLARRNAKRHHLSNIRFCSGDWCAALNGITCHMIVSNPPYLADADPHLQQGDLPYEPKLALVAGADGLQAFRHIVRQASASLCPGGWLIVEHGCHQGEDVRTMMALAKFDQIQTRCDLEQRERVTVGRCATDVNASL